MTVVLIQFSAQQDGSAHSGLLVVESLLAQGYDVHVIFASAGPMVERYRAIGCAVETIAHKNWLRGGGLLRTVRNVVRERNAATHIQKTLDQPKPDLVYVNTAASYAGALAASKLGIPCLWHLRELFSDAGGELVVPRLMQGWARTQFLKLSDEVVTNSRSVADNLLGAAAGRAVVIPNAVEAAIFKPVDSGDARAEFGLTTSDFVIGIPGTLRPVKGHRFALQALKPLLEQNQNLRIAITGDAKDAFGESLMRDFSGEGWERQILWTGGLPNLRSFYAACDAVVIPSSSETFGRTVIEAMASDLPVVATRVGGIPEIIDDGENGLLVDFGDDEALRNAVEKLQDDPRLRARLGKAASEKAKREYSEEVHAKQIVKVVQQTMAQVK